MFKKVLYVSVGIIFCLSACRDASETEGYSFSFNIPDSRFTNETGGWGVIREDSVMVWTDAPSWKAKIIYNDLSDSGWMHVAPMEGKKGSTWMSFVADTNKSNVDKEATVVFYQEDDFTVRLKELPVKIFPYPYTKMPAELVFPAEAGDTTICFYSNASRWECRSMPDWLRIEKAGTTAGTVKKIKIFVGSNSTGEPRTGDADFSFEYKNSSDYVRVKISQSDR